MVGCSHLKLYAAKDVGNRKSIFLAEIFTSYNIYYVKWYKNKGRKKNPGTLFS